MSRICSKFSISKPALSKRSLDALSLNLVLESKLIDFAPFRFAFVELDYLLLITFLMILIIDRIQLSFGIVILAFFYLKLFSIQ